MLTDKLARRLHIERSNFIFWQGETMTAADMIEREGEVFQFPRGGGIGRAKGYADSDGRGRGCIYFVPGSDVREGDSVTGTVTKKTYQLVSVEPRLHHGSVSHIEAHFGEERPTMSIKVGEMHNSAIQQNSPGATQSLTIEQGQSAEKVLSLISAAMEQLELSQEEMAELSAGLEAVKSQLKLPAPNRGIINSCFDVVKGVLIKIGAKAAGSAATAVANGAAEAINGYLNN